jgi:hypothetical protein
VICQRAAGTFIEAPPRPPIRLMPFMQPYNLS